MMIGRTLIEIVMRHWNRLEMLRRRLIGTRRWQTERRKWLGSKRKV